EVRGRRRHRANVRQAQLPGQAVAIGDRLRKMPPRIEENDGRRLIDLGDQRENDGGLRAERRDCGNAAAKLLSDQRPQQGLGGQLAVQAPQARDLGLDDLLVRARRRPGDGRIAARHDDSSEARSGISRPRGRRRPAKGAALRAPAARPLRPIPPMYRAGPAKTPPRIRRRTDWWFRSRDAAWTHSLANVAGPRSMSVAL